MSASWRQALDARLSEWRERGLQRELRTLDGAGVRLRLGDRDVLSFASNDYLGLASDPRLAKAAYTAMQNAGSGSGASPLITGHKSEHAALEAELAAFKQAPAALVFPSGYQASLAAIVALADNDVSIILDRLCHASLLDGAELSRARRRYFKHNDVADLGDLIRKEARRCLIVVESLYSMDGDTAVLAEISDLAEATGSLLLVDEAHATGVLGSSGRGALELLPQPGALPDHIIALGTLSKALGSQGGYVCAQKWIIESILHAGRAYMFSTALSPANVGAAREALRIVQAEPQRREHLLKITTRVRGEIERLDFTTIPGTSPIIPIIAGDEARATAWSATLLEAGLLVPAIRYPTVKKGAARLRISLSAGHSDADVDRLLAALRTLSPGPSPTRV